MERSRIRGIRYVIGGLLVAGLAVVAFLFFGDSTPEPGHQAVVRSAAPASSAGDWAIGDRAVSAPPVAPSPVAVVEDPGERWKTAPIEEIKQALYEIDIDSVEQLHRLDEFVQIGDADTRDFWNTDWTGVDDWKRNADGFSLERLDDGTLVFVPGEETKRGYTFHESMSVYEYDEVTQEFVHEVDYYGKPIVNIVKFLREDVMVMMVVSGQKVDMNLYELNRDRRDP